MTLNQLVKEYQKVFETKDVGSIALLISIIIGSKLKTEPVWLFLIGPSSGGKSALVEMFAKIPFVTQVSDLTPNTFLSGMSNRNKETSLLLRLGNNFVITMKDFTTILSKPQESQTAIVSQMREIYDGLITKETGTGDTLRWGGDAKLGEKKGHATFIMATTEAIFGMQEKFAGMGSRAINYILLPQDRKVVLKKALRNNNSLEDSVSNLQNKFKDFITDKLENLPPELPYVSDELEKSIIDVADFSTRCRSVVERDYRGMVAMAQSEELGSRMGKQLLSTAQLLIYLGDGKLGKDYEKIIYKIGLDSIPKQRRLVLEEISRHDKVSMSGLSSAMNYPIERCKEWINDLHMFKICVPVKIGQLTFWKIKEEYREIMIKYSGVLYNKNSILESTSDETTYSQNYDDMTTYPMSNKDLHPDEREEIKESEKQADIEW